MDGGSGAAEAERWLTIAAKLLEARDLHGTRTFALRARESDPRYEGSSQILAVADTLIAAESPVNGHPDWYAVLQLVRTAPDRDLIAAQHRKLCNLLNPVRNKLAFADLALKLVSDAWSVLSDPVQKSIYDDELRLIQLGEISPNQPAPADVPIPVDSSEPAGGIRSTRAEIRPNRPEGASFWTACPYCYVLFEYPKVYEECTLRCQNCRRAFHAAVIAPPLAAADGNDSYFCSWGFFPLGVSGSGNGKATGGSCNWTPISPMFACPPPKRGVGRPRKNPRPDPPRDGVGRPDPPPDDPDVVIEIPESSDDDYVDVDDDDDDDDYDEEDDDDEWGSGNKRKKAKNGKAKRKGLVGRPPKNGHKRREGIS